MMEYVDGFHGSRTLLLVAKYQIDPLVQASTHIVTLQSLHDTTNIKSGRLQSVDAAGESTKQASGLQTVCSRFTILRLSLTCSDSMDHCSLVGEPTIWQLGFDLPRGQWLCTVQGHCRGTRQLWGLSDDDVRRNPNNVSHCQWLRADQAWQWPALSTFSWHGLGQLAHGKWCTPAI